MTETPAKRPAFEPATRLLRPMGYDPDMPRPISIYAGVGLVVLRVLAGIVGILAIAFGWSGLLVDIDATITGLSPIPDADDVLRWAIVGVSGVLILLDALFALFVFRGSNTARVLVMIFSTISISTSFAAWWAQGQEITIFTTFISLSFDILILLALSSRSAAAYARRKEER